MLVVECEKFEGPLDLLLKLIEDAKLDITQISLAKITDNYLQEIAKLERSGGEMAEFLLIASKLLYIKSKELLPQAENDEEEDEIADLEAKLIEYQKYKEAAKRLEEILAEGARSYKRRAKNEIDIVFTPPKDVTGQKLFAIFEEFINKTEQEVVEEKTIETTKVTLEEKRTFILAKVKGKNKVSFREVLSYANSKVEVIVTFLAILEMIKKREIEVKQEKNFADFNICGVQ